MKPSVGILFLALGLSSVAICPTAMNHEEAIVRRAYGKAAFLTQLSVIGRAAIASYSGAPASKASCSDRLADAKLEFELTNFRTGDVSEIATIPWGDLVSQPAQSSQVLSVRSGTQDFRDPDGNVSEWKFGDPIWDAAPKFSPETISKVMEMNVSQVIQLGGSLWTYPDVVYSRYATYSVTLKFRGKRVGPYRAAFFFGRNAKGEEVASPQDQIVDSNVLFAATRESFYPTGLLRSRLRETAVASKWLKESKIDDASCQSGREELCCSELGCGVSDTDLQRELSVPLKPLRTDAANR